jgi:hypothetical protein
LYPPKIISNFPVIRLKLKESTIILKKKNTTKKVKKEPQEDNIFQKE